MTLSYKMTCDFISKLSPGANRGILISSATPCFELRWIVVYLAPPSIIMELFFDHLKRCGRGLSLNTKHSPLP